MSKFKLYTAFISLLFFFLGMSAAVMLGGCDGGGGGNSTQPTLSTLTVSPSTASLAPAGTQQFAAKGTFSDSSTKDLTSTATWTSSNTQVATISSTGLAKAVAAGQTTITAITSGVSGIAILTVTAPTLTPKEQVQKLENQGELPKLDRSLDIKGPDTNMNGIRDDIDTYIATLPISATQKRAVEQTAKALQATLLVDTANSVAMRQSVASMGRAYQCLNLRLPDIKQSASIGTRIEVVTFNSKERSMIYIQYNEALSGSVFQSLTGDTCDN